MAGYIPRWYTRPKTVTHPGTNRARRALTSFMRRTPLTTTPRRRLRSGVATLRTAIHLFVTCLLLWLACDYRRAARSRHNQDPRRSIGAINCLINSTAVCRRAAKVCGSGKIRSTVMALVSRLRGRGSDSRPFRFHVTTCGTPKNGSPSASCSRPKSQLSMRPMSLEPFA